LIENLLSGYEDIRLRGFRDDYEEYKEFCIRLNPRDVTADAIDN